jgi:hypothetical protein
VLASFSVVRHGPVQHEHLVSPARLAPRPRAVRAQSDLQLPVRRFPLRDLQRVAGAQMRQPGVRVLRGTTGEAAQSEGMTWLTA